ncbi:MAG TPA: nucleotidyl transferase AbiEii/AbiGii toxin family protein [Candidatus Aminicenantes bacterium]|nr:nucleotidyl transferase AbiEii/AbiGii toxin family protein [Candidatus Aminicenantes bacterium]
MIPRVLERRIGEYAIANALDQENVLQEIVQQIVLASLSRAGLFAKDRAVFHGGTCLRIAYGMNRFSEDLDFFLRRPDPGFSWRRYLDQAVRDGQGEGLRLYFQERHEERTAVRKAFLRTDSFGRDAGSALPYARDPRKLIKVKLEVDVNPPPGSTVETRYLAFPVTTAITTQSLGSGFAMKIGAMLGRTYTKGRDWYDFIWYVQKRTAPDLNLLGRAINQHGPWAGRDVKADPVWVEKNLKKRILEIDWRAARRDVERFLPLREQETLKLWDRDFFLHHLGILTSSL